MAFLRERSYLVAVNQRLIFASKQHHNLYVIFITLFFNVYFSYRLVRLTLIDSAEGHLCGTEVNSNNGQENSPFHRVH
jgi:hypothetical protein